MNKALKTILSVGAASLLAVSSFAAGSLLTIEVDPSIKILVNGEEFKPKDANGKDVMTFTYNGTTYAPLRALAEAYGLEVGYDSEKRMATVSEYEQKATSSLPVSSVSETLGMKNAVRMAQDYLETMAFSHEGLIEQLEYEGFSYDDALYGVNNCGADWNQQAFLMAQDYLDFTAFSREGLIKQLEYEGFTESQIEYAITKIGY